jgi:hypothetical protein
MYRTPQVVIDGVVAGGMRTVNVKLNVNIVGETASDDVLKLGLGAARPGSESGSGSGETPSIVQEEEEGRPSLWTVFRKIRRQDNYF